MLSNACTYGLRAMMSLAHDPPEGFVPVRTLAERLHISPTFLSKVFQRLVQAGLVEAYRGPSGGVRFARSPETITLKDVVLAVDGPGLFHACLLGLPGCGHERPCPVHAAWTPERRRLEDLFARTSLAATAASVDAFRLAGPLA